MNPYSIRGLRLVGFHNFEDETIAITGDLFVLGVNESGKTTVLDAIQLALSGGQDFEWNAAARLDGGRRDGRSLQGVILRADLSGTPHRQGPAITYAALELAAEGGGCRTLIYGASVAEMSDSPVVWGAVVDKPLSDVPLTRPNPDGSATVLGPDDLEAVIGHKVSRSVGHYRTRVAEALFGNRDEYARITKLWQTAKSYRELARASRHMNDLFLQVLPAPDPEPFLKVRKAFADIQKLRVDIDDLRREIGLLAALEGSLDEARESREALRRYEYVRAKGDVANLESQLGALRHDEGVAIKEAADLGERANEARDEERTIGEEMNLLRASEGFVLAGQITRHEGLITQEQGRFDEARGVTKAAELALAQSRTDLQYARTSADGSIKAVRAAGVKWQERAAALCPDLLPAIDAILGSLPASSEASFSKGALAKAVNAIQVAADSAGTRISQEAEQTARNLKECEQRLAALADEHRGLSATEDLLPDRKEVREALDELGRHGIAASLLYQAIEFSNVAPEAVRNVIESVLHEDTLFTIVVNPERTSAARAAVLSLGTGVRVLDAAPAFGAAEHAAAGALPSFLWIADDRVRAHVAVAFAEAGLVQRAPEEGDPRTWFIQNGDIGSAAARRRTTAQEPMWIGAEYRALRRQRRLAQLDGDIAEHTTCAGTLTSIVERQRAASEYLRDLNREVPTVANSDLLETQWRAVASATERESQDIARLDSARSIVERHRASVEQYRNELRALKQREGADAGKARRQYERLEQRRKDAGERLGDLREKAGAAQERGKRAAESAAQVQTRLHGAGAALDKATLSLLALPGLAGVDDLDQYVFQRKQGHLIKDPEQKIRDATGQEAAVLQRLRGADGVLHPVLASRFGFGVRDTGDAIEITDRAGRPLHSLVLERQEQDRDLARTVDERTRTLFEQVLATELVTRLREYRRSLEATVNGLNKVLSELRFGDSVFRVHHRPLPESKPLLELLRAQSVLDDANRQQLIDFLANRQGLFETEGEVPQFLDYRHWFEFSLERREVAEQGATVMGAEAMVRGSGGAQSTHAYLLLFALAALLFDRAGARARVLMMDEAFPNIDTARKELLLKCAKQLRLDLAIATPDLDGTILGPSHSHTTVLIERDEQHRVAVTPLAFRATPDQAELFAAPRPKAYIGVEAATRDGQ